MLDEPWDLEHVDTMRTRASDRDAAELGIELGDPVVVRPFELRGRNSGERWASGITTYPLHGLNDHARELLLSHDFIDDDTLEHRRRAMHHRLPRARRHTPPTDDETHTLDLAPFAAVLVFTRVTRTTTIPLGSLAVAARPDRFEVDYLIDA